MNDGLKQRLVGAVVLLALAVIFLPVFFQDRPVRQVDTETRIPPRPQVEPEEFSAPERPSDIDPAPEPEDMFVSDAGDDRPLMDAEDGSAADESAEAQAEPEAEPEPDNTEGADPEDDELEPGLDDGDIPRAWVVQVGSFQSAEAAARLRDRLQGEGYAAYTRRVRANERQINRVLIGPKVEKRQAQAIQNEVDELLGVNSLVTRFEP